MPLAQESDVADRLGRNLTAAETERVPGLIDEAGDLAIGYLGCEPSPPIPEPVTRVISRMVARVLQQDAATGAGMQVGVTQVGVNAGPFSTQRTFSDGSGSGAPWLERTDKLKLKPYRCGGGMVSAPMVSDQGR